MRKLSHILSVLLLGIYSIGLAHNVIPHCHHDGGQIDHGHENELNLGNQLYAHHHTPHHHENQDGFFNFVSDLFGNIEHSGLETSIQNVSIPGMYSNISLDFQPILFFSKHINPVPISPILSLANRTLFGYLNLLQVSEDVSNVNKLRGPPASGPVQHA